MDPRKVRAAELAVIKDEAGGYAWGRDRIAVETGITRNQARKVIDKARKGAEPLAAVTPKVAAVPSRDLFEDAASAFYALIGRKAPAFVPAAGEPKTERIAILSDIHAPWHDGPKLIQACEEAIAAGCETVLIAGDFFEYHRISSHAKSKSCTFEQELAGCRLAAEWIASQFKRRMYLKGNHEDRWERFVGNEIAEEIRFLVPDVTKLVLDGLDYEYVGHQAVMGDGNDKDVVWLAQVGRDAIVTHCQLSSAQQGVNLERLKLWLAEWGGVLGFTDRPRFITTGHTHRGTVHHEHDRVLVETGFLASWDVQDYQYKSPGGAQLRNRKPGTHGWTLLVQEDGVTNLRESGFRRLRG